MKLRKAKPFDVIRVDGKYRVVHSIAVPGGVEETRSLGDVLAHSLLVEKNGEYFTVADALEEAGWTAPATEEVKKPQ